MYSTPASVTASVTADLLARTTSNSRATLICWGFHPGGVVPFPCGKYWDAVSMPDEIGLPLIAILKRNPIYPRQEPPQLGPVLHDRWNRKVYVLVQMGHEDVWSRIGSGIRFLGKGSWIGATDPRGKSTPESSWIHLPLAARLGDPEMLAEAVTDYLRAVVKSRPLEDAR